MDSHSAETDPRSPTPDRAAGEVQLVAIEDIVADETFRLRPDGDISRLASSLDQFGQLAPVELRPLLLAKEGEPRWQVVSGFRRLAAARLLSRGHVLARLHEQLTDDEAWSLALCEALLHEPHAPSDLEGLRDRIRRGEIASWANDLLDQALAVDEPSPASAEGPTDDHPVPDEGNPGGNEIAQDESTIEVTPEELIEDLVARLSLLNQDLATAFEVWKELPVALRRAFIEQARYVAALLPFMEGEG